MKAQNRFWRILRVVRREMSIASATAPGSPRISVMPAACIATSVPVPSLWVIARPTSAAASAGASFRPSPTIATFSPPSRRAWITPALSPGSTSARTSSMPSSRPAASTALRLSPLTSSVRRPIARSRPMASMAPGLSVSPKASAPSRRGSPSGMISASQDSVRPSPSQARACACSGAVATPSSSIQRWLPSRSARPSTVPETPRPGSARRSAAAVTVSSAEACARAASFTARASGCSLPDCSAAARRSASRSLRPGAAARPVSEGLPAVSVPVLSKATTRTACATSSACASLIRMPWRAAAPVPTMIAAGVARPSAQGQAITSTATARSRAASQSPPIRPQPSSVSSASTITTGTKTALT